MNWKIEEFEDVGEHVQKFVFTKEDAVAEAVLYRYPTFEERTVICCSTQSGCPVGCRFCGAGDAFARSLTDDEIIEQVEYSIMRTQVNPNTINRLQIMFMSMGEPLLNLKNLVPAIKRLYQMYPNAALLISTSAPDVDYEIVNQLSVEVPTVGLQFSIHESTNERRDALIPFKKKMNLSQIKEAGTRWANATGRRPFFNYCAGPENSNDEDADRLMELFDPFIWNATISVICERDEYLEARNEFQRNLAVDFSEKLVNRGFDVRVFDPAGQDTIGGGCGQLHFVQRWFEQNPDKIRQSIGSGLGKVHAPKCS